MPRSRRNSTRSSGRTEITEDEIEPIDRPDTQSKRAATVYDAVAGRIGTNGFLTQAQLDNANILPLSPEEVLLRKARVSDDLHQSSYAVDEKLGVDKKLPDSDLLKAIHAYVADYYAATSTENGHKDFRTFDGSALLALGILLEEVSKDALGENGDMALVEPEGLAEIMQESEMTKYQVIGRVKPRTVLPPKVDIENSSDSESEGRRRKRRKPNA